MPSMDSNSSCYSSSGSSTSSLSSPRVPITDLVQPQQVQLPIRTPATTTTTTTITNSHTQSHACVTRYKTELCRPFTETGKCKYGDKCQFSHGIKELRILIRHPKYKTEYCRTFHTTGYCPYGPRCHFIHDTHEARTAIHSTDSNLRRHSDIRSNQSQQKSTIRNRFRSDYIIDSEQSTNFPFSFEDLNQALLSFDTGDVFSQEQQVQQQHQTYPSPSSSIGNTLICHTFSSSSSSSNNSLTPQYI